jgi:S1-C subfamily serine protease
VNEAKSATAANGNDTTPNDGASGSSAPALGVKVAPVDAAAARQLQLPSDVRGVIVTDVDEGSSASSHLATPETGGPDVILSVEGTAVRSPEELRAALGQVKAGEIVTLRVYNVPSKSRRIERVRVGAAK